MASDAEQGQLQAAPESFLSKDLVENISRDGINPGRRLLLQGAFAAAAASMVAPSLMADDDPDIVNLPTWTRSLGKPVVANPYGQPSPYEANIVRRQSPGLTRTDQSSVSFTPLQNLFGMITPSGLHFERHHQGWVDIDPALMMALEMQATRGDHAEQVLQWRKRHAGLISSGETGALAPNNIGLVRGRLSVGVGDHRLA